MSDLTHKILNTLDSASIQDTGVAFPGIEATVVLGEYLIAIQISSILLWKQEYKAY